MKSTDYQRCIYARQIYVTAIPINASYGKQIIIPFMAMINGLLRIFHDDIHGGFHSHGDTQKMVGL